MLKVPLNSNQSINYDMTHIDCVGFCEDVGDARGLQFVCRGCVLCGDKEYVISAFQAFRSVIRHVGPCRYAFWR